MSNVNNFMCIVTDNINNNKEVIVRHFDGTQDQAIKHFKKLPIIKKYIGNNQYDVEIKAGSFFL